MWKALSMTKRRFFKYGKGGDALNIELKNLLEQIGH